MGFCELCDDQVPDADLIEHLRVLHPDIHEPLEVWPDGTPVIVDTTLSPDDFEDQT